MRNKKISFCVVLVIIMSLLLISCKNDKHTIVLTSVYDGATIDLCEPEVRAYLEAETEQEQADLLWSNTSSNYVHQNAYFSWESDGSTKYTLYIADNGEFENSYTYETRQTEKVWVGSLVPGITYYWKVVGDAEGSSSAVDTFKTLDKPCRFITTETIINVRDIGGWTVEDGKTVNYELIYRGGKTNPSEGNTCAESDAKLFSETLGICTEIDLRTANVDDGGQTESVFGSEVQYVKAPMSAYTYILPQFEQSEPIERSHNTLCTESIKKVFEILSNEENYPVMFHCNAGADRTGTMAFLMNGVLGVSYEDLTKDFELTSFSKLGRRWRSDIVDGAFTDTGVMQDDASNYVAWDKMYRSIMQYYGTEDGTLKAAIENYLITVCNVKQEEINSFRTIMLKQ